MAPHDNQRAARQGRAQTIPSSQVPGRRSGRFEGATGLVAHGGSTQYRIAPVEAVSALIAAVAFAIATTGRLRRRADEAGQGRHNLRNSDRFRVDKRDLQRVRRSHFSAVRLIWLSAITTDVRQGITLKWSLKCHRGARSAEPVGCRTWPRACHRLAGTDDSAAHYCAFDLIAVRQHGSGGRLIAAILGRR